MKEFDFRAVPGETVNKILASAASQILPFILLPEHALVTEADLSFYEDFKLYELSDLRLPGNDPFYVVAGPEQTVLLDGTPEAIYRVNKLSAFKLNTDTVLSYFRFFCNFVIGPLGNLSIAESPEDVSWFTEAEDVEKELIIKSLTPLSCHGLDSDGLLTITGSVIADNALLQAEIKIVVDEQDITLENSGVTLHFDLGHVVIVSAVPITGKSGTLLKMLDNEELNDDADSESPFGLYEKVPFTDILNFRTPDSEYLSKMIADLNPGILPFSIYDDKILFQVADLPFYKDFKLCAFTDQSANIPNVRLMLYSSGNAFPLKFINEDIYSANEIGPIILSEEVLPVYARFFFFIVRGQLGRFIIAEKPEDIPWLDGAPDDQKNDVEKALAPLIYKGIDQDGLYTISGTVVFKNALFRTDIKVAPHEMDVLDSETGQKETMTIGQLKLENEDLLLENLMVQIF